jgi:hypothetical protein
MQKTPRKRVRRKGKKKNEEEGVRRIKGQVYLRERIG